MLGLAISLLVVAFRAGLGDEAVLPTLASVGSGLYTYYVVVSVLLSVLVGILLVAGFKIPILFVGGIVMGIKLVILQSLYLIGTSIVIRGAQIEDNKKLFLGAILLGVGCIFQILAKFSASVKSNS